MIPKAKDIKNFYYTMKLEDSEKFKVKIILPVKNKLFKWVMKLSFKNAVSSGNIDKTESFEIAPRFIKLIKNGISKQMKEISGYAKAKDVQIVDYNVDTARFSRDSKKFWLCTISVDGYYVQK